MMKKNPLDTVAIVCGILAFVMVIGSLVLLVRGMQGAWLPFRLPDFARIIRGVEDFDFGGGNFRDEGEERIETAVTDLEVRTVAGSISISGWSETYALVRWVKTAPSQRSLDNITAAIETRGERLTVKRESLSRMGRRGSVSFEIFIPSGMQRITAKSVSGSVRLTGMPDGIDQDLGTTSGDIETDNAADLEAGSISGSITFSFSGMVLQAKTVSGSIQGEMRDIGSGGSVKINSVSGGVRLAAFQGLDARVKLHSVSGSVVSELPISGTQAKRNRLEGTIGQGSIPLEIGTTSGSIRITKL
jgi:DUF4097 and DUF4098 domain-containing protein YvlB